MLLKLTSIIAFAALLSSCSTTKNTNTPPAEVPDSTEISNTAEIIIVDFEMIERKDKNYAVSFQKTTSIKGQLPESKIVFPTNEMGKFIVYLLDENEDIIEELIIKEPYQKIIEDKESQVNQELVNDQIRKNKFSVQFNENKNVKSIKILKMIDHQTVEIHHQKL